MRRLGLTLHAEHVPWNAIGAASDMVAELAIQDLDTRALARTALVELLENAVRFGKGGTIEIGLSLDPLAIDVTSEVADVEVARAALANTLLDLAFDYAGDRRSITAKIRSGGSPASSAPSDSART